MPHVVAGDQAGGLHVGAAKAACYTGPKHHKVRKVYLKEKEQYINAAPGIKWETKNLFEVHCSACTA